MGKGGEGGREGDERGGRRTEGTVDLDTLDAVFLSISWNRHDLGNG